VLLLGVGDGLLELHLGVGVGLEAAFGLGREIPPPRFSTSIIPMGACYDVAGGEGGSAAGEGGDSAAGPGAGRPDRQRG
jgi:hypothetical protein